MPAFDLSPYDLGRVGNTNVDALRVANQLVWQAATAPPVTQHSVFGSTNPAPGMTSHVDADPASWLACQFYNPSGGTKHLLVVGARMLIPAGSPFIGKTGKIGLMRRAAADGGPYTVEGALAWGEFDSNGAATTFTTPLVAGWNTIPYSAEYLFNPGDGIVIAYQVDNGSYYLYDGAEIPPTAMGDVDGVGFYLAESNVGTGVGRANYRGAWTVARWYGMDILVEEA